MKNSVLICVALWMILLLAGCWDQKELNDRAIWLATGMDAGHNGDIELSGQITIPHARSEGGGSGEQKGQNYFIVSATGKNIEDALQNLQSNLPREAFIGQRRVIFLGEGLAKRGLKHELDTFIRDPQTSFRTDLFVIKNGTAKEALSLPNPLETYPAVAALKIHREIGGRADTAFLNFLIAANKEGILPSIPALQISRTSEGNKNSSNAKKLYFSGASVFDRHLKMLGYLNTEENRDLLWIMNILKKIAISLPAEEGNYNVNLTTISSKIKPSFDHQNRVRIVINLKGKGELLESNSELDMTITNNLKPLEKKFEKEVENQVQGTIKKVQKEYGVDIFGFGEVIHRRHPHRWKSLKDHWDQTFPNIDVSVKAKIKIEHLGTEGSSVLSERSEVKK